MPDRPIGVGDLAPDFPLGGSLSDPARLSDHRGKSAVVLFFYPKADSPACTVEACAFRDSYEEFRDLGAEVIGISGGAADSHEKFATRRKLPFRMASDADGSVQHLYGVPKTFGFIPGRVTYVIDREGVVRHVFNSQFRPLKHAIEALAALKGQRG